MAKHAWVTNQHDTTCPVCKKAAKIQFHACGAVSVFHNPCCPGNEQLIQSYPGTCQQNGGFGTHKSSFVWKLMQAELGDAQPGEKN